MTKHERRINNDDIIIPIHPPIGDKSEGIYRKIIEKHHKNLNLKFYVYSKIKRIIKKAIDKS